jgi:hypothetical protein
MRVTPSPAALTIAAALAALVLLVTPSSAGAGRWQRPVPGEVTRSFDYSPAAPFARGAHRGADLAAALGDSVRAGCTGRVAYAGPVPGGGAAITLLCGDRRVTHLPLQRTTVQRGVRVRAGARIGTLAGGHGGLHLGVRAADDPFGYEDPLPLLPRPTRPVPVPPVGAPAGPSSRRPVGPAPERLRPVAEPVPPSIAARPATPATAPPARPLAPPLVWAGVAVAAFATAGTGAAVRGRRRRRPVSAPAQSHA